MSERLAEDDGPLAWLSGDRTVHVGDLTEGIVLTHRISAAERELGALTIGFDLAGFARRDGLRLERGDELSVEWEGGIQVWWIGPAGWLDPYGDGSLLAVTVAPDGIVTLDTLPVTPPIDPALVERLRAVYDEEVDEPGMPVTAEDLVLGLQITDRSTFVVPRAPLSELCDRDHSRPRYRQAPATRPQERSSRRLASLIERAIGHRPQSGGTRPTRGRSVVGRSWRGTRDARAAGGRWDHRWLRWERYRGGWWRRSGRRRCRPA